jgi:hypothetical protein
MSKRIVIVPPTRDQGSTTFSASDSYSETVAQNALWQYNKMREHDGQDPLEKMPKGTKYMTYFAYNASKLQNYAKRI